MLIKKIRFKLTSCHSWGGVSCMCAHTVEHGKSFCMLPHAYIYTCSCFEAGCPAVAFTSVNSDAERCTSSLPLLD